MIFWFILIGIYIHGLFYWLLFGRKQEFNSALLGLFSLGIAAFAIAVFDPDNIKLPDGTVLSRARQVMEKKAEKVESAIEPLFQNRPADQVDTQELVNRIKSAQASVKAKESLESKIFEATGRPLNLPEKDAKVLAEKLKATKNENERRELIKKQFQNYLTDENGSIITDGDGSPLTF